MRSAVSPEDTSEAPSLCTRAGPGPGDWASLRGTGASRCDLQILRRPPSEGPGLCSLRGPGPPAKLPEGTLQLRGLAPPVWAAPLVPHKPCCFLPPGAPSAVRTRLSDAPGSRGQSRPPECGPRTAPGATGSERPPGAAAAGGASRFVKMQRTERRRETRKYVPREERC